MWCLPGSAAPLLPPSLPSGGLVFHVPTVRHFLLLLLGTYYPICLKCPFSLLVLEIGPHPWGSDSLSRPFLSLARHSSDPGLHKHSTELNLSTDDTVFPASLWAAQVWGLLLVLCYTSCPGVVPGTQWSLDKYLWNERMPGWSFRILNRCQEEVQWTSGRCLKSSTSCNSL